MTTLMRDGDDDGRRFGCCATFFPTFVSADSSSLRLRHGEDEEDVTFLLRGSKENSRRFPSQILSRLRFQDHHPRNVPFAVFRSRFLAKRPVRHRLPAARFPFLYVNGNQVASVEVFDEISGFKKICGYSQ